MKSKINVLFLLITAGIAFVFLIFLGKDYPQNDAGFIEKAGQEEEAADALESMQFFNKIRSYPDADIPSDKFYRAFEYTKNNMQQFDEGDSPTQWTSIGPNNIGGRSLCLTVNPVDTGTIFMGSASGGLWKSTTGGLGANAWTLINTGYPSLAVSSIAIDSLNPNTMYIGTGENYGYQYSENGLDIRVTRGMYGIGILKTTNGGITWTKSLDWAYNNERGVWVVLMNPKNHNELYAATSEGVWKSNNAGTSWSQVLNYQMAMDLEINPIDTNILYVSIGDLTNNVPNANVGIYKTTNSGGSWTKLSGGLPSTWSGKTTIELYKGNPDYIYASVANDFSYIGYYTSTNGGTSWTARSTSVPIGNQGWYNNAHLVKSNDPNTIVVGTLDVEKSVNGGTSFTTKSHWYLWNTGATPPGQPESSSPNYSHADQHFFVSNPKDANKLYAITDGGLYRSNDFGETFYSCNGGYVTTQFYGGFANSYQDSIFCLGGLQDNRSAFYQGTTAWYKTFSGDGMWCGVNSQNSSICYTEYTNGDINKSNNGGISWTDISPPNSGNETYYCFVTPYIICRSNPNIVYIGGQSIYKSLSGGGGWQGPYGSFGGAKVLSMDASATSTDTVYAGTVPSGATVAAVYRTVDGTNWVNMTNGTIPNRYPTDIHVNPNNSKEVYVTFGGFGSGHVYKTTNAGVSWTNISGNLPDVPAHSVTVDPLFPQNVYVGNDLGVYVTTDGGASWYEFTNGMPYSLVFDLTIVYPNRHIRATTHGSGVFERSLVQNPVGITAGNNTVPKEFALYPNYPNPFNPSTNIKFDLPKSSNVVMKVYNIMGQEVYTLVNENLNAGSYTVKFNASFLSSGAYFCRLVTDNGFAETRKLLLVK